MGYKQIRSLETPQAVLVLGGSSTKLERERVAAKLALQYPDLPIWVSSGSTNKKYVTRVFANTGISSQRLHLDYQAKDTVTNFTTLVDDFQALGIKRIYVVTSDYHMRRARLVGEIVLGSRGIDLQPVVVPTQLVPETRSKALRDGVRAVLWVITGHTGSTLAKSK
ncbi:YdcF family protein [Synechocystis sp. PCC 7509]|uniref:YdcF family protein n=1 Tax=Synechocystis sp. PCC 7509 TaxID=927677 RepID=UPI0002D6E1E4|nr:YdcF family protein [Synechocystis sp. PCC 7509]